MSEFITVLNGKRTTVYDFDKCIESLICRHEQNKASIKRLEEENRKLKEEYSKDEEIQEMQKRLDRLQQDYWRGFPIFFF